MVVSDGSVVGSVVGSVGLGSVGVVGSDGGSVGLGSVGSVVVGSVVVGSDVIGLGISFNFNGSPCWKPTYININNNMTNIKNILVLAEPMESINPFFFFFFFFLLFGHCLGSLYPKSS